MYMLKHTLNCSHIARVAAAEGAGVAEEPKLHLPYRNTPIL